MIDPDDLHVFTKDDGRRLPVSDSFLLPYLTPTSPGTRWWEHAPPGLITERHWGRVLLQLHQVLANLAAVGVGLDGKRLLDIGTGNGMMPRLALEFTPLAAAVGADPYGLGEHKTSGWNSHDERAFFDDLCAFIRSKGQGSLRYESYAHLADYEDFAFRPCPVTCSAPPAAPKPYRFEAVGAHDLERIGETFDILFAQAIDHIHDWPRIFRALRTVAARDAVVYLKHFSFFSFLGPHRFATTNIPWGHVLLTDDEYRRFAHEFHAHRAERMIDFYFDGLSHPRTSVSGLIRLAHAHGFIPIALVNEPLRHVGRYHHLIDRVDGFWDMVAENHPTVAADELFSGRYHIVLRKVR